MGTATGKPSLLLRTRYLRGTLFGWTWKWEVTYKVKEGKRRKTLKAKTVMRAFTEDELTVYLRLNQFDRVSASKSGDALFMVAKRI